MFKLQLKDNPARSVWLVSDRFTLGAAADNDWVIDSLGVDDHHAKILIDQDKLTLESRAGTCYVNHQPVDSVCLLAANDELRIGKERIVIVDSKQLIKTTNQPKNIETKSKTDSDQQWQLLPLHAELKKREFIINGRAVIGRSAECDFSIPYKLLSREHAELSVEDDGLVLRDLDSVNGSFVNGKAIQKVTLQAGDTVSFAKLSFTVKAPQAKLATIVDDASHTMIRPAIDLEALSESVGQRTTEGHDSLVSQQAVADKCPDSGSLSTQNTQETHPVRRAVCWSSMVLLAVVGSCWTLFQVG